MHGEDVWTIGQSSMILRWVKTFTERCCKDDTINEKLQAIENENQHYY
jgi:hypothetical protein